MRRYTDILGSLLVREQLLLGRKIGYFMVCGALLLVSLRLIEVNFKATEVRGTVMRHAASRIILSKRTGMTAVMARANAVTLDA